MAAPTAKTAMIDNMIIKPSMPYSSFKGVIKIANALIITAMKPAINTLIILKVFSDKNSVAQSAVIKYLTISKSISANFSFLRKYLSCINYIKQMINIVSSAINVGCILHPFLKLPSLDK